MFRYAQRFWLGGGGNVAYVDGDGQRGLVGLGLAYAAILPWARWRQGVEHVRYEWGHLLEYDFIKL